MATDGKKARTRNQIRRQDNENRENGRYAKVNPCNLCDKSTGQDYYSDRRTDTVDSQGNNWGDIALVLCGKCARKLDKMADAEAYALLRNAQGWPMPERTKPEIATVWVNHPKQGWIVDQGSIPTSRAEMLADDLKSRGWQVEIRFPQAQEA